MKIFFKATITISLFVSTGCYYDKEEELYGANPCDTNNVSYSNTVSGLMNMYGCLGCHSESNPSGNIILANYAGIKIKVADGSLWGSINHISGFKPMPQAAGKMSTCDLSKIKAWIDAGAPNN
jgi:hypothetical protein